MFRFGHGLSYTQFSYRALKTRVTTDGIESEFTIVNTGELDGSEIAQLYVGFPGDIVFRPNKLLRGFEKVHLEPGARKTVRIQVSRDQLKFYDVNTREWRIEPGAHRIFVGGSSDPAALLNSSVTL